MGISSSFKRYCIALSLLMLLACGGGGDSAPTVTTAPNISLSQSTFDFTGIVLNNSADGIFEIRNTGNGNLRIGQISASSLPFSVSTDACSNVTLAPSQTCSLKVRFSPTSQGPFTATLSVPSNDPDSGTVSISLSGVGYGLNVWINQANFDNCPSSTSVDVTVTDPTSNGLLNLLTQNDFKLYENGQLKNVTATALQQPSPVSLVLAIDRSGTTANVLPAIKSAANTFIDLLGGGDWAAICKFDVAIEFSSSSPPLFIAGDAAGKTALKSYINSIVTGGGTSLYDAVFLSIDRAAQGPTTDKQAVIVLSDGVDDDSARTLDQVIANATQKRIPIFTIFYHDPLQGPGKTEIMLRLARDTGGQYYNLDTSDLTSIFQQISNVLSNKYTLTYSSPTCSGTISLSVRADWATLYGQDSKTVILP